MMANSFSSDMIGRVAIAIGISGLLGLVFITLFFTVGQPFGTLNDIFIGLTAIFKCGFSLDVVHHAYYTIANPQSACTRNRNNWRICCAYRFSTNHLWRYGLVSIRIIYGGRKCLDRFMAACDKLFLLAGYSFPV